MNNKILVVVLLIIVVFGAYILFFQSKTSKDMAINDTSLTIISPNNLEASLANKDFKLVDVHIPEQKHIPKTDYFIPYNELNKIIDTLSNKDEKIVLYCRSGGMSRIVAEELVQKGYTNIFDLEGGVNKWISENKEVMPEGTINRI